jgi:hypothetical protein
MSIPAPDLVAAPVTAWTMQIIGVPSPTIFERFPKPRSSIQHGKPSIRDGRQQHIRKMANDPPTRPAPCEQDSQECRKRWREKHRVPVRFSSEHGHRLVSEEPYLADISKAHSDAALKKRWPFSDPLPARSRQARRAHDRASGNKQGQERDTKRTYAAIIRGTERGTSRSTSRLPDYRWPLSSEPQLNPDKLRERDGANERDRLHLGLR